MKTTIYATTLATLIGATAPAYAAPAPLTPEPVVGAQVQILQNGVTADPTKHVLYEKGTPQTIELKVDAYAFERYNNKPHPVAGHALNVCLYPEAAYSDKILSADEKLMCYELPRVVFREGPTVINTKFSSGVETTQNQVEFAQTTFVNSKTGAKPNLAVGSYLLVTEGEVDGNPIGRDSTYAAKFKVLDAVPKPVEVKNIFADRPMELAYARHEPRPGTRVTLQSDVPGTVPALYIPHKWDVRFLPTLEEYEVRGMKYREEFFVMDGAINTNDLKQIKNRNIIEDALTTNVDNKDPRIVRYLSGDTQEFHFMGEFPASNWNTFWRGGDAGVSQATVAPAPRLTRQPTTVEEIAQKTIVDENGRPTWDNIGTLMHLAYNEQNEIIGWQQAYIITTPQVNSAAGPFILGLGVGVGVMALLDYLILPTIVVGPEPGPNGDGPNDDVPTGDGGFGDAGSSVTRIKK